MVQGHQDGASAPKSGVIRMEFDKDWIGSKGYAISADSKLTCSEAELLHHHITSALSNRSPQTSNIQLGNGHNGAMHHSSGMTGAASGAGLASGSGTVQGGSNAFQGDIAPDQTVPFDHETAGSGQLDSQQMTLGQAVGYTPDESVASGRKVAG